MPNPFKNDKRARQWAHFLPPLQITWSNSAAVPATSSIPHSFYFSLFFAMRRRLRAEPWRERWEASPTF